jgi:hypothetical protein
MREAEKTPCKENFFEAWTKVIHNVSNPEPACDKGLEKTHQRSGNSNSASYDTPSQEAEKTQQEKIKVLWEYLDDYILETRLNDDDVLMLRRCQHQLWKSMQDGAEAKDAEWRGRIRSVLDFNDFMRVFNNIVEVIFGICLILIGLKESIPLISILGLIAFFTSATMLLGGTKWK